MSRSDSSSQWSTRDAYADTKLADYLPLRVLTSQLIAIPMAARRSVRDEGIQSMEQGEQQLVRFPCVV